MKDILLSLFSGFLAGSFFALLKLPLPAPGTLAGVAGILGLFVGYIIIGAYEKR